MVDLSDYAAGRAGLAGLRMAPANPHYFTGRRLDFDIRDDGAGQTGQALLPDALKVLREYTEQFDKQNGTYLLQSLLEQFAKQGVG